MAASLMQVPPSGPGHSCEPVSNFQSRRFWIFEISVMAISLSFYGPLSCAGRLLRTGISGRATMLAAKKGRIEDVEAAGRQWTAPSAILPRAQRDKRIEYQSVDLQALPQCALARAKRPLGRNAD